MKAKQGGEKRKQNRSQVKTTDMEKKQKRSQLKRL